MRESIGATFLIKIMIVFIVLYNSILAIAVNYAMAFRVKNKAIDLLEQYEGCMKASGPILGYLNHVGYYRVDLTNQSKIEITPVHFSNNNRNGYYYKVKTFITFDFPFVGSFLTVPIKGETKIFYGLPHDDAICP